MSETVIKVENLSKQYRIGAREDYKTFRETLVDAAKAPFVRLSGAMRGAQSTKRSKSDSMRHAPRSKLSSPDDTIWALRNVSFEVKQGEVVGIIGRNGAGKSTLLKILCKITEPTEGRVELKGRVGSLLEVGTGFHPELTGHENIYLYGAILGMDRWEVTRKFDEIVAFAELEKFVETPVKKYSSGMYMRLAFAVAAYMETEILLVDEVLAVGDAAFQKKCMGKMGDISKEGRTVLFVSHNMPAVRNLCDWAIWLRDGSVKLADRSTDAVDAYLGENLKAESLKNVDDLIASLPRDEIFRLDAVEIRQGRQRKELFGNGEPIEVEIRYEVLQRSQGLRVYFDILDKEGNILVRTYHDDDADTEEGLTSGHYRSIGVIPPNLLAPTSYIIRVCATVESSFYDYHCCVPGGVSIPIQLQWTSPTNRSRPGARIMSKIQPVIKWQTETLR